MILFCVQVVSPCAQEAQQNTSNAVQEAQKKGITPEQLKSLGIDPNNPAQAAERARQMGATEQQIQDALKEAQQKQKAPSPQPQTQPPSPALSQPSPQKEPGAQPPKEPVASTTEPKQPAEQTPEKKVDENPLKIAAPVGRFAGLSYYGYDFFQRGTVLQTNVGLVSIDPGYIIGPGDILRIILWGEVEFQYDLNVNDDGNIAIPKIGPVFIAGTRYDHLESMLKMYISKFHAGLTSDPPTVFMQSTLVKLRNNVIYTMGEVRNPGMYQLPVYGTAFTALSAVGGPNISGSLRNVQIIRDGKVIRKIDFYDYLLKGTSKDDIRLLYNDAVFIPPRFSTVGIRGEVLRPAIYELKQNESLKELIGISGGLNSTAYAYRVQVDRIIPREKRQKGEKERELIDVNIDAVMNDRETVPLYDGDIVSVFPILESFDNYVDISGAGIIRPGRYELGGRILKLTDLIQAADGITKDVYLSKVDIIRMNDNLQEEFMEINLEKAYAADSNHNILLKRLDRVRIYSKNEMLGGKTISISGFVKLPGTYQYAENMTLYDVLFAYSGLQDSTQYQRTYLERGDIARLADDAKTLFNIQFNVEDVWNGKPGKSMMIRPGDTVYLYEKTVQDYVPQTVQLLGFVKKPGTYQWKRGMTLADLLIEGNGFTYGADIYTIEIANVPTGLSKSDSSVYVKELKFDYSFQQTFPDSVVSYLLKSGELKSNILEPQTIVFIRKNYDTKTPRFITINGEVRKPGQYIILEEGRERIFDVIKRAGGVTDLGFIGGATIERNGVRVALDFEKASRDKKYDVVLLPGDVIAIPPRMNTVFVQGDVVNPALYKFTSGKNVMDYVKIAGGKTENGGKISIKYATGELSTASFFNNPKVRDGSVITVYPKPPKPESKEKKETDWAEVVKESTAILSSAMMVIYLSKQIK